MTEKFVDLIHEIDASDSMVGCERETVAAVLDWLDEHPDMLPGMTLTKSEYEPLRGIQVFREGHPPISVDGYLGITIIPDQEPTNVERLQKLVNAHWWNDYDSFAQYLDDAGVKAPEVDNG